jgi:hypothetical protein
VTIAAWGLVALGLVTSGCSFGMNVAPADPSRRTHEAARRCTDSYLLPIVDTLGAGLGAYNVGVSTAADDKVKLYGVDVDKKVGLALGVTQLIAFGAAATYGYVQATRCNSLRHEQHLEVDPQAPAPAAPGASAQAKPGASAPPPVEAAPGTADDHDATDQPAPAASGGPPQHELPSWSAFRRMPLPAPSASASANDFQRPVR